MLKFGFNKEERLSKYAEYKRVYQGDHCRNNFFILCFIPNNKETNRVGFVIKKKYFKTAVARNRLRRLLKEAYRLNKSKIKGNFDMLIIAKKVSFSSPSAKTEWQKGKRWLGAERDPLPNYKKVEEKMLDLFKKTKMI
jgi:ribonuclease P protein component